ncbi:MAG: IS110 family transposase [Nitrospirota bacterium]|nr:IS110 family transposase [Nitrospirota bacterium]
MRTKRFEEKKRRVRGEKVIGVDPGMDRHQVAVIDESGMQLGKSFSIPVSYEGFEEQLHKKLVMLMGEFEASEVVFAVESSCNLWQTLCAWLSERGYKVVLVAPLTTRSSRALVNHDFSKTDPKDAYLVGLNAQRGHYDEYRVYESWIESMHHLSITWSKLSTDRVRNLQRLRSFIQNRFPEYLKVFPDVGVETSLYLLERYFLPQHFGEEIVLRELSAVRRISRGNYGKEKLIALVEASERSIGIKEKGGEEESLRIILDGWLSELRCIDRQMDRVGAKLVALAKGSEHFGILQSIKGVSELGAARLIAECRNFEGVTHYGQIEKFAGLNVRVSDSGRSRGARHINGIGNKRLNHLLNQIVSQVVRYTPEVANKYMRRQLIKASYRKNLIASIPNFLKLIVALMREKRAYEFREEAVKEMLELKEKYEELSRKRKWRTMKFAA